MTVPPSAPAVHMAWGHVILGSYARYVSGRLLSLLVYISYR